MNSRLRFSTAVACLINMSTCSCTDNGACWCPRDEEEDEDEDEDVASSSSPFLIPNLGFRPFLFL